MINRYSRIFYFITCTGNKLSIIYHFNIDPVDLALTIIHRNKNKN